MDPPEVTFYDIPSDIVAHIFEYMPSKSIADMEWLATVQDSNIWYRARLTDSVIAARATVESFLHYKFLHSEYFRVKWFSLAKKFRLVLSKLLKETPDEELATVKNMTTKSLLKKNATLLSPFLKAFFDEVPTDIAARYLRSCDSKRALDVIINTRHVELYKVDKLHYDSSWATTDVRCHELVTQAADPEIYIPIIDQIMKTNRHIFALQWVARDAKNASVLSYVLDIPGVVTSMTQNGNIEYDISLIIERNQGILEAFLTHKLVRRYLNTRQISVSPLTAAMIRSSAKVDIIPILPVIEEHFPELYESRWFQGAILSSCNTDVISYFDERDTYIRAWLTNPALMVAPNVSALDLMKGNWYLRGYEGPVYSKLPKKITSAFHRRHIIVNGEVGYITNVVDGNVHYIPMSYIVSDEGYFLWVNTIDKPKGEEKIRPVNEALSSRVEWSHWW